ncbi:arad-like aldolase/epimerase [Meredithblackwellia eburnea MCA 4105]
MTPSAELAPTSTTDAPTMGYDDAETELAALTKPPTFESKAEERKYLLEKLAGAIRIFAMLGFDHQIAGHLTVRDPENPHHFWVNPFGLAFRLMTVSDLILVDSNGKVIGGGKPGRRVVNLAGFQIHSAIHKARPDVQAICHSHSLHGKAFSTLGKELAITTQDSCAFYNDIALLSDFGGVVIKGSEGSLIAKTIKHKKAIILQNHGILTVGTTIDAAVAWFILLETQCQVQLLSDAAGTTIPIDEPQAEFTAKSVSTERAGYFKASPYFQVIEHLQGHEYKQ